MKGLVTMVVFGVLLSVPMGVSAQSQQLQQQPQKSEDVRAKAQILIMENALKQAVLTGAKNLSAEMRRFTPVVDGIRVETMLVGMPTAQGVRIPPHGVVFLVTVPGMNANFIWASYQFSPAARTYERRASYHVNLGSHRLRSWLSRSTLSRRPLPSRRPSLPSIRTS